MRPKNEIWSWPLVDAPVDAEPIALEGLSHRTEVRSLRSLQDPEDEAVHGSDVPLSKSSELVQVVEGVGNGSDPILVQWNPCKLVEVVKKTHLDSNLQHEECLNASELETVPNSH